MNYYFIREDDSRCRYMVVSSYAMNAPGTVVCRDCALNDAERITRMLNDGQEAIAAKCQAEAAAIASRPVCPPNTVIRSGVVPPSPPPPPANEDPEASPYRSDRGAW